MAVAWLIDLIYGDNLLTYRHRESVNYCAISISGGRRKSPYNGDKLKAHAMREQKAVSLPLYCIL